MSEPLDLSLRGQAAAIAGGDVTSYSAVSNGLLRSEARRSTVPALPNVVHGVPRSASRAMRRPTSSLAIHRRPEGSNLTPCAPDLSSGSDAPAPPTRQRKVPALSNFERLRSAVSIT